MEDLLAIGRVRLLSIPQKHRENYNYTKVALKNAIISGWRQIKAKEREMPSGLFREEADEHNKAFSYTDPIHENVEMKIMHERLRAAIATLPETERTVVLLLFGINGDRKSLKGIARSMKHRNLWVKTHYSTALCRLRIALAQIDSNSSQEPRGPAKLSSDDPLPQENSEMELCETIEGRAAAQYVYR